MATSFLISLLIHIFSNTAGKRRTDNSNCQVCQQLPRHLCDLEYVMSKGTEYRYHKWLSRLRSFTANIILNQMFNDKLYNSLIIVA